MSRLFLSSGQTRITHYNPLGSEIGDVTRISVGKRADGTRRRLLAIQVRKPQDRSGIVGGKGDLVIGLSFLNGNLEIELLNSTITRWRDHFLDLSVEGAAFERFANRYVETPGKLVIDGTRFQGSYRCWCNSDAYGDSLVISQRLSKAEWLRQGCRIETILVNLSALFALGPLAFHDDGRVFYGSSAVGRLPVVDGELLPIASFSGGTYERTGSDFVKDTSCRLWERLPLLRKLQACEAAYLGESRDDRALEEFRTLLPQLAA